MAAETGQGQLWSAHAVLCLSTPHTFSPIPFTAAAGKRVSVREWARRKEAEAGEGSTRRCETQVN